MGERDDPQLGWRAQSGRAVRLMELLGLSEEELCQVLDVDPLTLLSGQLDHRGELQTLEKVPIPDWVRQGLEPWRLLEEHEAG
jgi:hypothetical protein